MTIVLVAIGAVLATLVVVLVGVLVNSRRARPAPDQRLEAVVSDMNTRMEAMMRELTTTVERAEEESRRNRMLAEIVGSIDIDEVLSRTLEAAGSIPGADAALVSITALEGKPLIATLGLSADEAERQAIMGPPNGRQARSITMTYRYPEEERGSDGSLIHSGVAVPLGVDGESLGFLIVFTRSPDRTFGDAEIVALEALAKRAGPAIENARRFREARQLADLDALTGLHNRRYFHETLAREVARAHRYNRNLALIVFDLDDFKEVNDRVGHLGGDAVLAEAAERVRDVVRSADVACRVGGDEFAVILPESTLGDADQLYRRIEHAVSSRQFSQVGRLLLSAGITELRAEDDPVVFFQRADNALYRAKEAGKGQAVAANQ